MNASGFLALALLLAAPAERKPSPPTFCVEWIRQSREGYERFTLFTDRTLVWKTARGKVEDSHRRKLPPEEVAFYCAYFARPEVWELAEDMRTGLTGEFAVQSSVTLAKAEGARRQIRFDDLSPMPAEGAAMRAALEGLKLTFVSPLAPASRFTPETLSPGTYLKRFDGVVFRVRLLDKEKGIVELEGVRDPYSEFRKIEELRFQFSPPE
jgi:hypothetical protein